MDERLGRTQLVANPAGYAYEKKDGFEAELGYGLRAPIGRGIMTPYTALSLKDGSAREMRVGARLALASETDLGVEASRSESRQSPDRAAFTLHVAMHW